MKIAFLEGSFTRLGIEDGVAWISDAARTAGADAVLLPEMPIDPWLCDTQSFDAAKAQESLEAYDALEAGLAASGLAFFLTRPVAQGPLLANQAFYLAGEQRITLHSKQIFPNEPGWHESQWFRPNDIRFQTFNLLGVRVGFAICTELFWPVIARHYFRNAVDVILAPRATGGSLETWIMAGRFVSVVSGAYVISSNRGQSTQFNGGAFAVQPGGEIVAVTDDALRLLTVTIDPNRVRSARQSYPVYITEPNIFTFEPSSNAGE